MAEVNHSRFGVSATQTLLGLIGADGQDPEGGAQLYLANGEESSSERR